MLSPQGILFLEDVFAQFSQDQVLTRDQVDEVFSVVPSGNHPFGSDFPYNCRCSSSGAIPRDSWLQLWRMVAMIDSQHAMRALYGLGFGLNWHLDATKALAAGPCVGRRGLHSFLFVFVLCSLWFVSSVCVCVCFFWWSALVFD